MIFIINQGREYKFEAIRITAAIGLLLSIVFAYSIMSTVGCLLINSLPASDRNQTRNELIKKLNTAVASNDSDINDIVAEITDFNDNIAAIHESADKNQLIENAISDDILAIKPIDISNIISQDKQ